MMHGRHDPRRHVGLPGDVDWNGDAGMTTMRR
jgi:hypothetical protein